MEKLLFLLLLIFGLSTQAASDSVGVFHRPEKVIVLMTEIGSATRLKNFIQAVSDEAGFTWLSADESLKIQCAYETSKASCTFRLLPSSSVIISDKRASAEIADFPAKDVNFRFESSQKDVFELEVHEQNLKLTAAKR